MQVVVIVADPDESDGDVFSFVENELSNARIRTVLYGFEDVPESVVSHALDTLRPVKCEARKGPRVKAPKR